MKRADRLFSIILILQSKPRARAQDLAEQFGVTKRTIYRDIASLVEVGVPVVSKPGEGYQMMEGFTLPPLMLSLEETRALLLSAKLMQEHAEAHLKHDLKTATDKLRLVLPHHIRRISDEMNQSVSFYVANPVLGLSQPDIAQLDRAIRAQNVVRIAYRGRSGEHTTRHIEPYRLVYAERGWYIEAYCRLRQARREFKLTRVEHLAVLSEVFEQRELPEAPSPTVEARIWFANEAIAQVRERQHYGYMGDIQQDEAGLTMQYLVHTLDELTSWLLTFGQAMRVVSPTELHETILEVAHGMVAQHTT